MSSDPAHAEPATSPFSRFELPTWALASVIYGGWALLTALHTFVPTLLLFVGGSILTAWHGSLQHETIHGHPTRLPWVNTAVGFAPLSLWLPYAVYRRSHVAHHVTPHITDPFDDPESQYLEQGRGLRFRLAQLEATLLGRLIVGPPIRIGHFLWSELLRVQQEPLSVAREWLPHLIGVAAVLWWLHHAGMPVVRYFLCFVYPGTALPLLRSFAEHRANADPDRRAAIVAQPGMLGLLYLNNNLHAVHHARPGLAWYRLPAYYRRHRAQFATGPHYETYGSIVRRHLLRPHDAIVHPLYGSQRENA
ncbi:MAG: fatty acid desaturase [Sphingobium sp.]